MFQSLEYRRQGIHVLFGCFLIALFQIDFYTKELIIGCLLIVSGLIVAIKLGKKPFLIYPLLQSLERPHHLNRFPARGLFFYLLGAFLVAETLPTQEAQATIAILAFGDSISNIIGRHYGKISTFLNRKKMIEGSLVGWIAGGITASLFISPFSAFPAAGLSMITEIPNLKIKDFPLDDNITIPLTCVIYFSYFPSVL